MTDSSHLTSGLLIRALDGELDVSQRLAVEQHLSVCEQCLSEFERWADLSSDVNRAFERAVVRVPGEAREALASKLIQEARPASRRVRAVRWLWAGAAAASLAIAATFMMHDRALQPVVHDVSKPKPSPAAAPEAKPAEHPTVVADRTRRKSHDTARTAARAAVAANVPDRSFIRLPYSNPALPLDNADVIRVRMRLSSLTNAGVIHVMPGTPDNWVQADVLLGMDGEPSGIRLVSSKLASRRSQ